MTEQSDHGSATGPAQRTVELSVAVATALFACIVIVGSLGVGIGWGAEGPQAGFFPFYVGVLILIASAINFAQVLYTQGALARFAYWNQLGQVLCVLVPTAIYVALVPWIGMYVASILLIAVFMRWLGRYDWRMVAAVSIGVPLVTFVVFEKWFLVPLPKGPIEAALGY
jgi:hypothetical protein